MAKRQVQDSEVLRRLKRVVAAENAKTTTQPPTQEATTMTTLRDVIEGLLEAIECSHQPYQLSGLVTPESPGGQLTATRRDGTKVDRFSFMADQVAQARAVLARMSPKGGN